MSEARGPGQPTKWKPAYNEEIVRFFERKEPYREQTDAKGRVQFLPERMPFFSDFAAKIGVDDDTLMNWANADKEAQGVDENGEPKVSPCPGFFGAYARAKQLQKRQLIEGALAGAYAPQFSIFLAKNITDMRDKQELEHTGKDGAPLFLPTTVVAKNKLDDSVS